MSVNRGPVYLGPDDLFHLADPGKLRIGTALFLPVEDSFAVQENLHNSLRTGSYGDGRVRAIVPKKLVSQPRG